MNNKFESIIKYVCFFAIGVSIGIGVNFKNHPEPKTNIVDFLDNRDELNEDETKFIHEVITLALKNKTGYYKVDKKTGVVMFEFKPEEEFFKRIKND